MSVSSLSNIVRRYMIDLEEDDNMYRGYFPFDKEFDFVRDLKAAGFGFSTKAKHSRAGGKDDGTIKGGPHVQFNMMSGLVPIDSTSPFRVIRVRSYDCIRGKAQKKKNSVQDDASADAEVTYSPKAKAATKKIECPAQMQMKEVDVFVDFVVDKSSLDRYKRSAIYDQIREAFRLDPTKLRTERRIYVAVAKENMHNHPIDVFSTMVQEVDAVVINKIHEIVHQGTRNIKQVRKLVESFVRDVLFKGLDPPPKECRAFNPTDNDLTNHVQNALRNSSVSVDDQEDARKFVEEFREKLAAEGTNVLFRPCYQLVFNADKENEEEVMVSETLLFCYQSTQMKKLMETYGHDVWLVDSVNKTLDYPLPLYFIAVRAAFVYQVVGIFLVQFNNSEYIAEALRKFRTWCPNVVPQYFLADNCSFMLNAINEVFSDIPVFISSFQRHQAWESFIAASENGVSAVDREVLLDKLTELSKASSESEFQSVLDALTTTPLWLNNAALQDYMTREWFSVVERWAAFARSGFGDLLDDEDGLVGHKAFLKSLYLNKKQRGLAVFLRILLLDFTAENLHSYLERSSHDVKPEVAYFVPDFLKEYPKSVMLQQAERREEAIGMTMAWIQITETEGSFLVCSGVNDDVNYMVDFRGPSCQCYDFAANVLPCKHFWLVFQNVPDWSFDKLPTSYLKKLHSGRLDALKEWFQSNPRQKMLRAKRARTKVVVGGVSGTTSTTTATSVPLPQVNAESQVTSIKRQLATDNELRTMRRTLREHAEKVISYSYHCFDLDAVKRTVALLRGIEDDMRQACKRSADLPLNLPPAEPPAPSSSKSVAPPAHREDTAYWIINGDQVSQIFSVEQDVEEVELEECEVYEETVQQ